MLNNDDRFLTPKLEDQERNKKEDETVLEKKERERGRLTFWSTCDVSPNADQGKCEKSSC